MLTDIFLRRYENVTIWKQHTERDKRVRVQAFRIIKEHFYPIYNSRGDTISDNKDKWKFLHDIVSMELGVSFLSDRFIGTYMCSLDQICENFVCAEYAGQSDPDKFLKERFSFIEVAFRERGNEIRLANLRLPQELKKAELESRRPTTPGTIRIPGNRVDALRLLNERDNTKFQNEVNELNTRFQQARYSLHYHNGLIQISSDSRTQNEIGDPFWAILSDPLWKSVDIDMKEAIDRRDTGGRDSAFYAAKALESTIKIISDIKTWTTGSERGAINYIDNLMSKNNGSFIEQWEAEFLKLFFKSIRNKLGHGPGTDSNLDLGMSQNDWAIEYSMIWIKSLVTRM